MEQSDNFLLAKATETEIVGQGVSRQILGYNNNIMLVKVMFEKGSFGDMHSHSHVQTSYIAGGKFEVTIDGKTQTVEEGDGFFVAENETHGVACLEAGIIIDCFSPVREDFLK